MTPPLDSEDTCLNCQTSDESFHFLDSFVAQFILFASELFASPINCVASDLGVFVIISFDGINLSS